jgi:hypothetical protein
MIIEKERLCGAVPFFVVLSLEREDYTRAFFKLPCALPVILSGAKNLALRQILHFVQDDTRTITRKVH